MKTVILILCVVLAGCEEHSDTHPAQLEHYVSCYSIHRNTGFVDTIWTLSVRVDGNMTYTFGSWKLKSEAESSMVARIPFVAQSKRIDRLAADSASLTVSQWFITARGDTIWTKWLYDVNMRLIRLAADSARCARTDRAND